MPSRASSTWPERAATRQVSLIALPEAVASTLFGVHDAMNGLAMIQRVTSSPGEWRTAPPAFHVSVIGERPGRLPLASGVAVDVTHAADAVDATDIVVAPSLLVSPAGWRTGRYPRLVDWVRRMHERGALVCSACSGIFLLAETGLYDGRDATVHYAYARAFAAAHSRVSIHPDRALVVAGEREELISSGASTSWHDLVLYLIARFAGPTSAQDVARFLALQWHETGLSPYIAFEGRDDHGDSEIRDAQEWLRGHFSVASPVEATIRRSQLAPRTFKRRFASATGLTPMAYVQRLRIEDAKRRLERTDAPIDEISWRVGYEDPAFFRRLFKRTTGLAPGAYRKRFRVPDFARFP